jgi:hypothetical protein
MVGEGSARQGSVYQSGGIANGQVAAGQGMAWIGLAWQGEGTSVQWWRFRECQGGARFGAAGHGGARQGTVRLGGVRSGAVRRGRDSFRVGGGSANVKVWDGTVRHGKAGRGEERIYFTFNRRL